ncbi:hypothetical protein KBA27_00400 [bacterium]|nr:hypothetical protein [bacterium]
MDKRWYDTHEETIRTLERIKELDEEAQNEIAASIIEIAKQIKDIHKEEDEPELSLGINRVLGLYQSSNSRRWYDKNSELACAMRTIATLPEEDFKNIMEGLSISLGG